MSELQNTSNQKNPLIGVISLCISIISILGLFCTVAIAGFFVASGKARDSLEMVVVGMTMFGFVALGIVSIVLGCVDLALKNKRKSFAITGISLSAFAMLVFASLLYVGLNVNSNKPGLSSFENYLLYEYHYKYIAPEDEKSYLEVEKFWKKVHLKAMADQKMLGWSLCKIEPNNRQSQPYNYVTINVYDSMEGVNEGSGSTENFNQVYGAQFMNGRGQELRQQTARINNIVHGEVWTLREYSEQSVAKRLGYPGDVKFTHFLSVPKENIENFETNGLFNLSTSLHNALSRVKDSFNGFELMALSLWNLPKPKHDYLLHESFSEAKGVPKNSGSSTVGTRAIDPLIQTMGLDIRKELWEVVDSTAVFPNLSGPSIDLSGDWVGKNYRCSSQADPLGTELMEQHIQIIQDDTTLVATKITGDDCVPAGNTTWEGEIVDLVWEANKSLHGTHIFGTIYGSNPVSGELFLDQAIIKIVNANHLELLDGEIGESLSFHRLVESP